MVPVASLLLLRFELAREARFRFFHSPTVYAFLHARLGTQRSEAFPPGIRLLAVESGRTRYEAGDAYHVALALFPSAPLSAREVVERLQRRVDAPRLDGTPLGPRTRLVRVTDLVSGRDITRQGSPEPLTMEALAQRAALLADQRRVSLRFDSPLLILRRPVQRRDTFLDGDVCDPGLLLERIDRAASEALTLPGLLPPVPAQPAASCPSPRVSVRLAANHLVRAETYYRALGTRTDTTGKILPGATGRVVLELDEPLGKAWALRLLVAGLYGAGKSTAMGQGRFHVEEAPVHPNWPPLPASTFCERMAGDSVLLRAREAIARGGASPGVDEVDRAEFLETLTYRLPLLREALASGEHRAQPLRGLVLQRKDGGVRPLAVPTLEDRFLQRAAMEELGPALDELFEETSFAYRRGLSRRNAEQRVRQAHDEGYRHVLDADLRAFFDRVDWGVLRERLTAYLGPDPVVPLLMRWVQAPVEFGGELIQRRGGLPQGAVVSPMLANLYLDAFDEAILAEGFRLVRYGDDFVVLCKSRADAARAREVVERELSRIKLELAQEKTSITSFDTGFEFLGYVFARSISLEKQPTTKEVRVIDTPEDCASLQTLTAEQARGWLSDWLQGPAEAGARTGEPDDGAGLPRFQTALAATSPARRKVYVVQPGLRLTGSRRGLRVYEGDTLVDEVAWTTLSEIAVLGQRAMGPSFFQQAMRHRIPVALYTRSGRPTGMVLPDRVRVPTEATRAHWAWMSDTEARLRVARALVEAKIHNQRLLVRHQPGDTEALRAQLTLLGRQATRAERFERLRGIEGAAAHAYFSLWRRWVPEELSFVGRTGRGARDPVNALLNLLYTQLFHRCWLACVSQGLDAYAGTLHVSTERYAALAADLQESFRFLCDRLVLELFRKRRLGPSDFVRQEKPQAMTRLKLDGLKLVLSEWERRLETRVGATGGTRSYRGHILAQAQRFAEVVRGERQDFPAFRLKW